MAVIKMDTISVDSLLTSLDRYAIEYSNYIDLFFKELLTYNIQNKDENKAYRNYINSQMIEYINYIESFKKFINTTKYSVLEIGNKITNDIVE